MNESWTGFVYWRPEGALLDIRLSSAELRLGDQGGRLLLYKGLSRERTISFGWEEVEKVMLVRCWGILFQAVHFTLARTSASKGSREFAFGALWRIALTHEILDFAESKGTRGDRKARFRIVWP
jgi:hypothetical protein